MTLLFEELSPSYMDWFTDLNNKNIPAVNALSKDDMQNLIAKSELSLIALDAQKAPIGGIVTFREDQTYQSNNYKWFGEHCDDFLYIDRIIVDKSAIGQGVGLGLYGQILGHAEQIGVSSLVCEINEVPPNPQSMVFHRKMGFEQIKSRFNKAQGKKMAMMQRNI